MQTKQLGVWTCDLYGARGKRTGRLHGYANLSVQQAIQQIKIELEEIVAREYVRYTVDESTVRLGAMEMV